MTIPDKKLPSASARGIITRFVHLLTAQGAEAITSTIFFLYLAWLDASVYGEVMYALAAGAVVTKIIQFGLYYPLVSDLGSASPDQSPRVLNRVNIIKLLLLIPTTLSMLIFVYFRGFTGQTAAVLLLISAGFAGEAVAETYFADLRVRGRQNTEARIKMISALASYGYGLLVALVGLGPVMISFFKLVSAAVRMGMGIREYVAKYKSPLIFKSNPLNVALVFKAASVFAFIEILGIIYNKTNIFFLEGAVGVKGVAFYSATWNLIDPISTLASEQFLGWVIFPLLAVLWLKEQDRVDNLVRVNAQWLMALAFPIMFFLYAEAELLIGLIYPTEYKDAVWMQQYLVWTILLSFENNLFSYVMMVAGAAHMLLYFAIAATALNLIFNILLIKPFGLLGGCIVIILTKLVMTLLTFSYCQIRFRFFKPGDFLFPILLASTLFSAFVVLGSIINSHAAVFLVLSSYLGILFFIGPQYLGKLPTRKTES
jgi:O-antigen/teichoic acid export membrane protein